MKLSLALAVVVFASLDVCVGCGGSQPGPREAKAPSAQDSAPASSAPASSAQAMGANSVRRSQVKHFAERPGEFFQSVDLDDKAVFADGKFHGFRVLALRDGLERSGLQPGDVVVSVNKLPIERPEQAIAVFRSLEKAKELRVDYERNGEPKTMTMPIIDDGAQAIVAPPAGASPATSAAAPAPAGPSPATSAAAPKP